jgi:hypothetical protein
MTITISAQYQIAAHLARHLQDHRAQGALLLPLPNPPPLQQFDVIQLSLGHASAEAEISAEVLQIIPGLGVVVRLFDLDRASALAGGAEPSPTLTPPTVTVRDGSEEAAPAQVEDPGAASEDPRPEEDDARHRSPWPRGMGPVSWSLEKLQAEWSCLSVADKVRVAKYGKRPARGMIMRLMDSMLHNVLLSNPQITPEEVAILAGTGSLDSAVLKRIATSQEWVQHTAVARNLICHPKTTLPQITKLIDHLPDSDLLHLTRTGKVRAAVKRLIIKKIEQRSARR